MRKRENGVMLIGDLSWRQARHRRLLVGSDSELAGWALDVGAKVICFECGSNNTATKLVAEGKRSYGFPAHTAANWHALNDVLHDWGWVHEDRILVLFSGISRGTKLERSLKEVCLQPLSHFYFRKPSVVFAMSTAE